MKELFKNIIKKFGYIIVNKKKSEQNIYNELNKFNLKIDSNKKLLFNSYRYIKKIESCKLKFSVIKENEENLIVSIDKFKFLIESTEDIFILSEVFIDKDYNFLSNEELILIDIGLNIGISSVFFSTKSNVKHIYSYEPVPYTYNIACKKY